VSVPTQVSRRLEQIRWSPGRTVSVQLWFPLVVYIASRLITAAYMIAAASAHRTGYDNLATAWDGVWYRSIATGGYPSSLPIGVNGQVEQNTWAFSPGYPLIVRGLMAVTGLNFSVVAPALSLALGAVAIVVVFVLMERAVSRFCACACVILTCTFMAAPVFQIAYSDSLALLLLASALLKVRERKYLATAILLLLLALTRPVVLAFIPVVIAHGVGRLVGRASDPFPVKDRRAVALLAGWCVAATALWPVIVAISTGDIFAWTKTQEAWRTTPHFAPLIGWPASFLYHFGWPALVMLVITVLLTLGLALRPGARAWGPELRTWSVAYPAFLLLATVPGPSVIRWLLLAFPLMWPFPETEATRSERSFRLIFIAALAVFGLALQWFWVSSYLASTPPSSWYP
jgi:hypothetical protein